jgi:MFS family permease
MAYVVSFLLAASIGLVFVFLADLQDDFGLSEVEVSIVASTGFLAALVSQLVLSPLVDRGHASGVARTAVIMGVVGTVGFGLGTTTWVFALSRGLVGIGLGLFGIVARKALLGLDAAGGGAKVGALLSSGVAGFISGPAIGATLGTISFEAPFVVLGVAMVVPGAVAARLIAGAEIATAFVDYSDIGALLARPRVQVAMLSQFVVFGFIGIFDATVDRYMTDVGLSTTAIATCLVIVGSPMLVLPARAGAYAERAGGGRVVLPAIGVAIPVILLYGYIGGAVMFALVGLAHAMTESFSTMGAQVLVLEATGAERAAIGSSILEATGLGIASVTAGVGLPIYAAYGEVALFGGWAFVSALCLIAMVARLRAVREPPRLVTSH